MFLSIPVLAPEALVSAFVQPHDRNDQGAEVEAGKHERMARAHLSVSQPSVSEEHGQAVVRQKTSQLLADTLVHPLVPADRFALL